MGDTAISEPMPAKLDPNDDTERLNVIVPKGLMQRLNEWRAANGFVGKSEATRTLLERALSADATKKAKQNG